MKIRHSCTVGKSHPYRKCYIESIEHTSPQTIDSIAFVDVAFLFHSSGPINRPVIKLPLENSLARRSKKHMKFGRRVRSCNQKKHAVSIVLVGGFSRSIISPGFGVKNKNMFELPPSSSFQVQTGNISADVVFFVPHEDPCFSTKKLPRELKKKTTIWDGKNWRNP